MTNRLPKTLKKKLEASLENLTARQAGRLFLIYANECLSGDSFENVTEYPPAVDLMKAWDKRVKAAQTKGGDIQTQTLAAYNGFLTLTNIIRQANNTADSDLWRLYTLVIGQGSRIDRLLLEDSYSDLTRVIISQFTEDAPRPLSWEDYDKAAEWYEGYSTEDLEELSHYLTEDYSDRQGYTPLEVPEEFLKAISTPEVNYQGEDEDIRRKWVESEGEDLILTKYFAGDKDRLEAWKQHGGSPEFNGLEWDTMAEGLLDRMVNMVISGELEGGLCFALDSHWSGVPALGWNRKDPDNTAELYVPAWNALRSIWISWLYDEGIFRGDDGRVDKNWPDMIDSFYDAEGTLEEDRLTEKAKKFYQDCQKKPWGSELIPADKVDFVFLARFLCTDTTSPLMGFYAPDLGTVKMKAFHEAESDDAFMGPKEKAGDVWYYATLRGLRKIAADLGTDPDKVGYNSVREFYYPTDNPETKRRNLSTLISRMNQFRVSHRPFTFKEKNKREISSYLGLKFYTPLEAAIRDFGQVFDAVDTFKMIYDLISQELFEGIPVLSPYYRDRLVGVEEALKVTESNLNQWIEKLSADIWNVDTSSLRLVKNGPNEKEARFYAAGIIYHEDDTADHPNAPTWLDGGETFESIAKKISGLDYAGMKKELLRITRGKK